jgi:membrane AbrB-like protein
VPAGGDLRAGGRIGAAGQARRVALTLAVGVAGGWAAERIGFPAGALLGATLPVSAVALSGRAMEIPAWLRNLAFAGLGCSLGAGFTPDFLSDVGRWPLSLAMLCAGMLAILACCAWVLVRFFGFAPRAAVLSTSPGALSYTIALALGGGIDTRPVMVLQSLRLLTITLTLPPALLLIGQPGDFWGGGESPILGWPVSVALIAAAFAFGRFGESRRVPAAFLLAGMILSGALHATGAVEGMVPGPLVFAAFVVTGCVIGSRFTSLAPGDLRRLAAAALTVTAVAIVLSALLAVLAARLFGIGFAGAWIAYAPGGVEGMAAMAIALGYDPAFVATHHLVRIVFLIMVLPFVLRVATRISPA